MSATSGSAPRLRGFVWGTLAAPCGAARSRAGALMITAPEPSPVSPSLV
ncbi:hypothetical protein [Sorangium sp. So ce861]